MRALLRMATITGVGLLALGSELPLRAQTTTNGVSELPKIEVAQAVMVTVDLDFGTNLPTVAEALRQIERRYVPADGQGRTFAILDAYGGPVDGKLRISIHASTEKEGDGSLAFRRTGEVLWRNQIVPASHPTASEIG